MLNVEKVKELAKEKGVKIGHLCAEVGRGHTYLNDIARSPAKNVPEEHIYRMAEILGTTYEYLTDQETAAPGLPDKEKRKFCELYERIAKKETAETDLAELERFMKYLAERGE